MRDMMPDNYHTWLDRRDLRDSSIGWLVVTVNGEPKILHPEKQDSEDGDATTLIMMTGIVVVLVGLDDDDGDDHVCDDDVGDENS